jgi:Flp pilus assembly protein CpaB
MAVAYAARPISSGSVIDPADVGTVQVDRDSPLGWAGLPPDAVFGRTAVGDLAAGEMVTANRITDGSVRPGFAAMPVSFATEDLTQFLTAGSRIDIVWAPGEFSDRAAEVVVRDARILQVAPPSQSAGSSTGASVLLEVAEADAVRLAAAMTSGSLSVLGR